MPLQRCRSKGKSGWKFGSGGTCYIGPGARSRARAQGAAIKASQARRDDPVSVTKSLREAIESTGVKLPTKKKASRQASGKGLERKYTRRVLNILDPYFTDLRERLIPTIPTIVAQYNNEVRLDAYGEVITKSIGDIKIGTALQIPDSKIKAMAEDMAEDISDFNKNQLNGQFKSVLGVNPLIDEPYLQPQINSFVERNAALITNVPEQSIGRIETKIRTNVEKGKSIDNLTAIISSEIGIAENRAKLIARDQTNKFMGKLNELRQTEAGVDEYEWSTSEDERVRSSHAAHDGKIFKWSEPPADTGHPGEDIQCRCVAIPVFDEFLPEVEKPVAEPPEKDLLDTINKESIDISKGSATDWQSLTDKEVVELKNYIKTNHPEYPLGSNGALPGNMFGTMKDLHKPKNVEFLSEMSTDENRLANFIGRDVVDEFDKILMNKNFDLEKSTDLFFGVSGEGLSKYEDQLKGGFIQFPGSRHTATDFRRTLNYSGANKGDLNGAVFSFTAPKGSKAIATEVFDIPEMVFLPGSKFKIKSDQLKNITLVNGKTVKMRHIDVELINDGTTFTEGIVDKVKNIDKQLGL